MLSHLESNTEEHNTGFNMDTEMCRRPTFSSLAYSGLRWFQLSEITSHYFDKHLQNGKARATIQGTP